MIYRTVSAKRQISLGKDVLEHLGVKPGDKINCEMREDGMILVKAAMRETVSLLLKESSIPPVRRP